MKISKCTVCKKSSAGESGVRGTIGGTVEEGYRMYDFCSSGCYTSLALCEWMNLVTFDNGKITKLGK